MQKLQSLKELKPSSNFCYSTKGRYYKNMTSITDVEILAQKLLKPSNLMKTYEQTRNNMFQKVNNFVKQMYGIQIKISNFVLTDLSIKIKNIMNNVEQIKKDIHTALGYKASFLQKGKPIPLERIIKAWELAKQKARFIQVENALYGL